MARIKYGSAVLFAALNIMATPHAAQSKRIQIKCTVTVILVVFVALAMIVAAGGRGICAETADAEAKAVEADEHDPDVVLCPIMGTANHISKTKSNETIALCSKIINDAKHSVHYRAIAYQHIGNALSDAGNDNDAMKNLTKSIELNPHDAGTFGDRGTLYKKMGLTQKALDDYKQAVSTATTNTSLIPTFQSMAIIYNDQEQYDLAIAYQTKAIELALSDVNFELVWRNALPNLYKNRGTMLSNKGDSARAQADFAKAVDLEAQRRQRK